eukprot:UN26054
MSLGGDLENYDLLGLVNYALDVMDSDWNSDRGAVATRLLTSIKNVGSSTKVPLNEFIRVFRGIFQFEDDIIFSRWIDIVEENTMLGLEGSGEESEPPEELFPSSSVLQGSINNLNLD